MASFSEVIVKWAANIPIEGSKTIRKIGLDTYKGILRRSPVKTGRFRASNRIAINTIDTSVESPRTNIIREKFGTSPDSGEAGYASAKLKDFKWGNTIYLTNSLIYAKFLENGGSSQNGHAVDGIYGATFSEIVSKLKSSLHNLGGTT